MAAQDLLNQLLKDTYTEITALRRLRVLRAVITAKLFTREGVKLEEISEESSQDQFWINSLDKNFWENFSRDNVYHLFDDLQKELAAIQPLTIFLPIELPPAEINRLGQYLRESYGANFLMEIKYDPNLIAGPALARKGIYRDYSLHQKMVENRQSILESIKKQLKH